MAQLIIPDIGEAMIERLQERASAHGLSAEEEAQAILEQALRTASEPWTAVNAIREELAASGKTFSDSAELLREDRER